MPVVKITHRIGTTAEWVASNPTLLNGEVGIELTTSNVRLMKIGDGSTTWDSLPYMTSTKAQSGAVPVGILDPTTNKVGLDDSWNIVPEEVSYAIEHGQAGQWSPLIPNNNLNTLYGNGLYYGLGGEIGAPSGFDTESPANRYLLRCEAWSTGVTLQTVTARDNYKQWRRRIGNDADGAAYAWTELQWPEDYVADYYPKTDEEKASAGDSWWRKWKSGFIEQGGYATRTASTQYVNLNIPMKTTKYTPAVSIHYAATSQGYAVHVLQRSTTRMQVYCASGWSGYYWFVSGY